MKKYFIPVFFLLLLVSCKHQNYYADKEYPVVVLDKNNLLENSTHQKIAAFDYPKSFAYMVRTTDSVNLNRLGATADEYFKKDAGEHPDPIAFLDRGVYIFVSQHPQLVQLRMGQEIRLLTNWKGISAGKGYIKRQQLARRDIDKAVMSFIYFTADTLPEVVNISGVKQIIYDDFEAFNMLGSFLSSSLEYLHISPESFYSRFLLKPVLQFRIFIGSNWLTFVLVFIIAHLVFFVLNKLIFGFVLKKAPTIVTNTGSYLLRLVINLGFLLPAVNSVSLLTGARMEERIMLKQLHLSNFSDIVFQPEAYNTGTAWWLAFLFALVYFLKSSPKLMELSGPSDEKPEKQQELYQAYKQEKPFEAKLQEIKLMILNRRSIKWELEHEPFHFLFNNYFILSFILTPLLGISAWLFLPKVLTVAAIYFWLIVMVNGLFSVIRNTPGEDAEK